MRKHIYEITCIVLLGIIIVLSVLLFQEKNRLQTIEMIEIEIEKPIYITKEIVRYLPMTAEAPSHDYTDEEVELLARLMLAEARGESEYGRELVISTVLNRVDSDLFPDTIEEVIFAPTQFSAVIDKSIHKMEPTEEDLQMVEEQMIQRVNDKVLYFRCDKYHNKTLPLLIEGNHYFSAQQGEG